MSELPRTETYLGDGLYAAFDGWSVVLRAPREGGDHWVGLEPQIWQQLVAWIRQYPLLSKHMEQP